MAKIFITGSSDGLGLLAARHLISEGHQVILHARHEARAKEAMHGAPEAHAVLVGDLGSIDETKLLAEQANALGTFDAVIHNAGVYSAPGDLIVRVNTLAPYILTCLMHQPQRLIYLSSGMHKGGHAKLDELLSDFDKISYSDSKLHNVLLTKAVARHWPGVYANAVDPGWVPTKMGGASAPDSLEKGYQTQCWLATSRQSESKISGGYFYHGKEHTYSAEADDIQIQQEWLSRCEQLTGVSFPVSK